MSADKLSYRPALLLVTLAGLCLQTSADETTDKVPPPSRFDQVVVEMPATEASTGAVALARINISLRTARERAVNSLCEGNWTPAGAIEKAIGPYLVETASGETWHYRALRSANPLACRHVTRARFFIEMSRHLPSWFSIRPAGYRIAFRNNGEAESISPSSLAKR